MIDKIIAKPNHKQLGGCIYTFAALLILFTSFFIYSEAQALNQVTNYSFESPAGANQQPTGWTRTITTDTSAGTPEALAVTDNTIANVYVGSQSVRGRWTSNGAGQNWDVTLFQNFTPATDIKAKLRGYYKREWSSGGVAELSTVALELVSGAAANGTGGTVVATAFSSSNGASIGSDANFTIAPNSGIWTTEATLTAGAVYTIRIRWTGTAMDNGEYGGAWVDGVALSVAPAGLTSPSQSPTKVSLSWTDSTTPSGPALYGYNVYSSTTSGGPYTKRNTSIVTTNSYTVTGLTVGTTYYFVATDVSVGNDGIGGNADDIESSYSAQLTQATATTDTTPPTSSISTPASGTYITSSPYSISGTSTDNENVASIEVSTDGGATWNPATCSGCPGSPVSWSYSWTLPASDGLYTIKSRAKDTYNNIESPGAVSSATVDRTAPQVLSTTPTTGATNVVQNSNVTIKWNDNIDCTTVNTASVTISPSVGWALSTCNGATAVFTPAGQASNITYTVTVSTSVKDMAGFNMASAYSFSYRTGTLVSGADITGDGNLLRRTNRAEDTCGGPNNACHNLRPHNATNTASSYWSGDWGNTSTSKYGKFVCQTCHTPHDTENIFLIREKIKFPDSSTMPSGSTESEVKYRYRSWSNGDDPARRQYTLGDDNPEYPDSPTGRTTSTRICEVCHSETKHHRYNASGQPAIETAPYWTHNNVLQCTKCHSHSEGFKKPYEADSSCGAAADCHQSQWNAMNSNSTKYYMYLNNTDVSYPLGGSGDLADGKFGSTEVNSTDRKCLMCHAMMSHFSPIFDNTVQNRAMNLRKTIYVPPDGTPNYVTDTDYLENELASPIYGGVCTSCHQISQFKANASNIDSPNAQKNDGTTQTPVINPDLFKNSPHNYQVNSRGFEQADIGNPSFKANCLKCHNEYPENTNSKMRVGTGPVFAPHSSTERSLHAPMSALTDPIEERFCYNCHSNGPENPNAGVKKDYYGVVDVVNSNILKIKQIFDTSTTKHSIDSYAGLHRADEGVNAESLPTSAPAGWFASVSGGKHVECADCHNPHSQNKSGDTFGKTTVGSNSTTLTDDDNVGGIKAWTQGQWRGYVVQVLYSDGTTARRIIQDNTDKTLTINANLPFSVAPAGVYYNVIPTANMSVGNKLRGPNNGAWGVDVNYPTNPPLGNIDGQANPTFTKIDSLTSSGSNPNRIYQLCFKCHSDYGWGNGLTPFNIPDVPGSGASPTGTYVSGISTNIAKEFNPNNLGHHPVVDIGENQPLSPTGFTPAVPPSDPCIGGCNITAGSTASVTATLSSSATENQYTGYCAEIVGSGTGAGQIRSIEGNTAAASSVISVDPDFAIAPGTTNNKVYIRTCSIFNTGANYDGLSSEAYPPSWPRFTGGTLTLSNGSAIATLSSLTNGIPATVIPGWYIYAGALRTGINNNDTPDATTYTALAPGPPMLATKGWFQIKQIITSPASGTGISSVQVELNKAAEADYCNPASSCTANMNYALTAGLGNNFVPPYGPWSVIACTDCHQSANSDDPAGPHGSANRWILKSFNAQSFQWFYGGLYDDTTPTTYSTTDANLVWTVSYPDGNTLWPGQASTLNAMPNYLCLNCHRSDVYGFEDNSPTAGTIPTPSAAFVNFSWRVMSRVPHIPDNGKGQPTDSDGATADGRNPYRIMCMNCHGGDARATKTANTEYAALGGIHGSNLGKGSVGTAYRGRRLLNGAAWAGVSRATTAVAISCWNPASAVNDGISACNQHAGGAGSGNKANYPYYSGAD